MNRERNETKLWKSYTIWVVRYCSYGYTLVYSLLTIRRLLSSYHNPTHLCIFIDGWCYQCPPIGEGKKYFQCKRKFAVSITTTRFSASTYRMESFGYAIFECFFLIFKTAIWHRWQHLEILKCPVSKFSLLNFSHFFKFTGWTLWSYEAVPET